MIGRRGSAMILNSFPGRELVKAGYLRRELDMEIKSVINKVLDKINQEPNTEKIKVLFCETIKESKIKEEDKKRMLSLIQTKKTHFDVLKYVYDCLLKYEGCGVIQ